MNQTVHCSVGAHTLLLLTLVCSPMSFSSTEAVTTTSGVLTGNIDENGIHSFKGIRYAQSPTGKYRWQSPRPFRSKRVFSTTAYGPRCLQTTRQPANDLSEDCLFLNVWTPSVSGQRPVMVSIHGGGFRASSGNARAKSLLYLK